MNRAEKIAKIRVLAERGATEGERAAARAALERLGESTEDPAAGPFEFKFRTPPQDPKVQSFIDMMMGEFNKQYSGMTAEEIMDDILRDTFGSTTSTAPHHHGRVHFDSNG